MSNSKLTIVPVLLLFRKRTFFHNQSSFPIPIGTIKLTNVEISFFNGVDEHIIQTIMQELNKR